jgi:acyl carrier protein
MSVVNLRRNVAEETQIAPAKLSVEPSSRSPAAADIQARLVQEVARLLEVEPGAIDVAQPFERYGLDSIMAVDLTATMEEWLGRDLSPTLPYEYPTIQSLSQHLAELPGAPR